MLKPPLPLTVLSEAQRAQAQERFEIIRPALEEGVTQAQVARTHKISASTVQNWIKRYQDKGFEGWKPPGYDRVRQIIKSIDPALETYAHQGAAAYREEFDLLYRREATHANAMWQTDHTPLDVWLLDEEEKPAKPYLTAIEDDYSRMIVGYRLSFQTATALTTALTLRQAIWRKEDPRWSACGIPSVFSTDQERGNPHGFMTTKSYRRFREMCDACRRSRVVGLGYGPPGTGKTESAKQYAQWSLFRPFLPEPLITFTGCSATDGLYPYRPFTFASAPLEAAIQEGRTVFYTPSVSASVARLEKEVLSLFAAFSYLVEVATQGHQGREEFLVTRRFSHLIELLVVDEANRLKDAGLELQNLIIGPG